ncbi:hypothetical protein Tco_0696815 [Tanacetum coccineum]
MKVKKKNTQPTEEIGTGFEGKLELHESTARQPFAEERKFWIHGEVSNRIPVWNVACDETGVEFKDIIYEKADGEAIAKVK